MGEIPNWADYLVNLWGNERYADYLAGSVHDVGGRAVMLGDGWVALDANAVGWLKAQPEDADGCIDCDMMLWMQGSSVQVVEV